jgi:hypothetical protein
MPRSAKNSANQESNQRCFGLRIESELLQLAVAIPLPDNRYRLEIDSISCEAPGGWLTVANSEHLTEALAFLAERHEIRRERIAVSLDGDFCVTRVAMGTTEVVDKEQSLLAVRVPRYLQLGPGEKVTGSARKNIAPAVDYAVTGVVNRSIIQLLYEALRSNDLNVTWVEPSLVSVARLLGRARVGGDRPVLIADGMGNQWDVGIACSGRLLLDYRPASATTIESLRDALKGHISRLKRFCQRHRGIASGELRQLFICGDESKTSGAENLLGDSIDIETKALKVPILDDLYDIDAEFRDANSVPSVATVLPLLIGTLESDVPDLLDEVRRAADLPLVSRMLRSGWPVLAATLVLAISFGLVSGQRIRLAGTAAGRAVIESQIKANEVRFSELSLKRDRLSHLVNIRNQSQESDWQQIFEQVTQSLPDSAKLNSFRVENDGHLLLNGTVTDETLVFELVNDFRRLPGISQVALRGTAPDEAIHGTRFTIRLTTLQRSANSELGESDE